MKRKILVLFFLLSVFWMSHSQEHAWVYLVDKANVSSAITNPNTILTQKAIDRKNRHGIAIDARDVPINENYISQLKAVSGITVKAKSKWFNAVHVIGSKTDIETLENLSFVNQIEYADNSINTEKRSRHKETDKLESALTTFNYGNAANQIEMFEGDELHKLDYTGNGITVAILDSGFPNVNTISGFESVRNSGNIVGTYDFVNRDIDVYTNTTSNHGTLVFSDLAGYVDNQFVGTAPDAAYHLFITEDATNETPVEEGYWVEAAERADSLGVDIINTSLGYSGFDVTKYDYSQSDMNGSTAFITRGANIAFEKGLLLVISAGNSGNWGVTAPADSANVLSIGAVDAAGHYASFSSIGTMYQPNQKPDVVAQGQLSYVITENNTITTANGTSFSAPILAGGLACLWQALPDKTNAEIMQLVRESASQFNTPDEFLGYGIPNLQAALNTALSTTLISDNITTIDVFPNPTKNKLYIELPSESEIYQLYLYNVLGKFIAQYKVSKNENRIEMSTFSEGLYLVKIESENTTKYFKILKQ